MLFALMALAAANPAYPAFLAPAASGQVQCYVPSDHKTCVSTSVYTANSDGTFTDTSAVLLSKQPAVVLQISTPTAIKSGAVCAALRQQDVIAASISVNGQVIPPEKSGPILQKIAGSLSPIIGHEICTTFVPADGGFVAKASMDGKPQPAQDQKVIWVSPSDGYTVAP